jgi:MoaA/NifB/PqqE/SkfB family radical SAM enzyme
MLAMGARMLFGTTPRVLGKFLWNFGVKGVRTVRRFRLEQKNGGRFPAFVFLSVTNDCNLRCQGCWVSRSDPALSMDAATLDRIIRQSKARSRYFFGILGGEPLLHRGLLDVLAGHPDCYFQLFTNGTLLTDEIARALRRLGNVTPLVSVEGLDAVSDQRRGGVNVYEQAMAGIEACRANRLIVGVASSVCKSNFKELVTETFLRDLVRRGVHYAWYYIYRPTGANPTPELALSPDDVVALRRFLVEARCRVPIMVVDAYWDEDGRAFCPAASGLSHHIGPGGDVEPCPPIQFATTNVREFADIADAFDRSELLARFRTVTTELSRGCILLEHPGALLQLADETRSKSTSGRHTGRRELALMRSLPSHHLPGREIAETSAFYRFAKRNLFFGFGAYG